MAFERVEPSLSTFSVVTTINSGNEVEYQLRKRNKESSFLVHLLTFAKKKVWFVKENVYGRVLWVTFASQKRKAGIDLRLREDFYHKYTHGIWIDG